VRRDFLGLEKAIDKARSELPFRWKSGKRKKTTSDFHNAYFWKKNCDWGNKKPRKIENRPKDYWSIFGLVLSLLSCSTISTRDQELVHHLVKEKGFRNWNPPREEECLRQRLERGLHAMGPTSRIRGKLILWCSLSSSHLKKLMQKMIILIQWLSSSLTWTTSLATFSEIILNLRIDWSRSLSLPRGLLHDQEKEGELWPLWKSTYSQSSFEIIRNLKPSFWWAFFIDKDLFTFLVGLWKSDFIGASIILWASRSPSSGAKGRAWNSERKKGVQGAKNIATFLFLRMRISPSIVLFYLEISEEI